nr:hypothetical protein [Pseudomonas sp. BIGb0427]
MRANVSKAKLICPSCLPPLMPIPVLNTPTEFRHGTINLIKDSLGATLSVAGSSYSKSIAIGLYEEFSE